MANKLTNITKLVEINKDIIVFKLSTVKDILEIELIPGYVEFWSFETAALAKILELDDTSLINNNHYPYELAHYKNSMKFKSISINEYNNVQDVEEIDKIVEGIENNPLLEKIIPTKWHSFVNQLIHDYEGMDDSSFYEKYKKLIGLDQIWFLSQEYEKENVEKIC